MFNKKRITGFLLSCVFILAAAMPAFADSGYASSLVTLQIGSRTMEVAQRGIPLATIKTVELNTSPTVVSDTTMIPLRGVLEPFGCVVTWHPGTFRQIEITQGDNKIAMTIGSKMIRVNDKKDVKLAVAPIIIDGSTVIPLRFVSETMGLHVEWLADTREIKLYDGNLDGLGLTPYRVPGKDANTIDCLAETDSSVVGVMAAVQAYESAYRTFDAGDFNADAVKATLTPGYASSVDTSLASLTQMMKDYGYGSSFKSTDVKGIMFDSTLSKATVGVETSFLVKAINDKGTAALNVKPGQVLTKRESLEVTLAGKEWKVNSFEPVQ